MKLKNVICTFCFTVCLLTAQAALCLTPEELFKKNFPALTVDSIKPTPIDGIYEIVTNDQIIYYSPQAECIIVGNIITKDRKNLTDERLKKIDKEWKDSIPQKIQKISLDKSIKIGNGKISVIEFTDPDCPFCRQAFNFFSKRTDVTEYVFFHPLPMHPNAMDKARYVLCSKNRAKAYAEAMSGKLDDMKFNKCADPKSADEILKTYEDIALELHINSTPFFYIKGQVILGADIPAIEKILSNEK